MLGMAASGGCVIWPPSELGCHPTRPAFHISAWVPNPTARCEQNAGPAPGPSGAHVLAQAFLSRLHPAHVPPGPEDTNSRSPEAPFLHLSLSRTVAKLFGRRMKASKGLSLPSGSSQPGREDEPTKG